MRKTVSALVATVALLGSGLVLAAPAQAATLLNHQTWSCEEPYSGELECGPAVVVPPGGYLWVGEDTDGPNIFTAYTGEGDDRTQVGWIGMWGHGAGRLFDNHGTVDMVVHVFEHADAPENRCGTRFESGFYEVYR